MEQYFAKQNIGLIQAFLDQHRLDGRWYPIIASGYLKAAKSYDPAKAIFKNYAYFMMRTAYYIAHRLGLIQQEDKTMATRWNWTHSRKGKLVELHAAGKTPQEIAAALECEVEMVIAKLTELYPSPDDGQEEPPVLLPSAEAPILEHNAPDHEQTGRESTHLEMLQELVTDAVAAFDGKNEKKGFYALGQCDGILAILIEREMADAESPNKPI